MPFEIVRNDICKMQADAIVNTANPKPVIGAGTDSMIHAAAGPALLKARQAIGDIAPGSAALTPAYGLNAKHVIHTVGPVWQGGNRGEEDLLRSCYERSLALALKNGCQSIAFPLISTGAYGFPKDKALQIAIQVFSSFLPEHEMQIYLVVFDRSSFQLSEKLFCSISSYIDDNYVRAAPSRFPRSRAAGRCTEDMLEAALPYSASVAKETSLEELLRHTDRGFSETLLQLIDQTGKKDSYIYNRANVSRQHFSKIRNNPQYKPSKATALAFAIALELDLKQTEDLIGRAGYALTNSSKFDVILRYFIERKNYNIVEINMALYEFDQSLLG